MFSWLVSKVFFTAFFTERRNWRLSFAISAIRRNPDCVRPTVDNVYSRRSFIPQDAYIARVPFTWDIRGF